MADQELPPDTTAQQKLYWLNALQVVGNWSVHDDDDGRLFYYDRKLDASQWEVPEDLASLETEFMMKLMLQNAVARSGVWTAHDAGSGTLYYFNAKTRESAWERPSEWGQLEAEETVEKEQLTEGKEDEPKIEKRKEKKHRKPKKHKEKRQESQEKEEPAHEEVEEEEPLTTEELQAAQERSVREMKRVEQFRAMLRDRNIMPFCKWSVALPQIAGDPRFIGVPTMEERRAIFEHFVEHRREELKADKKNKLKQAKKLFAGFLCEQFLLDSWTPSTTLSVFLSTLEGNLEPERYKQIQDDALALLTVSTQEKIYSKAVADYKSDALKRDGEQLGLTKFLDEKLQAQDKPVTQWDSENVQELVRAFYSSAALSGESTALLSVQKQKQVYEEVVARTTREEVKENDSKRRSLARGREHSRDFARRELSPRRESRQSDREHHRYRSHSRRRRSRSESRSQSRGRDSHRSRRRSASRSRSRGNRSSRRSSRHSRHYSSLRSRSYSRS